MADSYLRNHMERAHGRVLPQVRGFIRIERMVDYFRR